MVFIGITGPSHSGKKTLTTLLVEKYHFTLLKVDSSSFVKPVSRDVDSLLSEDLLDRLRVERQTMVQHQFASSDQLISFVLSNYTKNFVTVIPDSEFAAALPVYGVRPCFLAIAMDCPLQIRFESFAKRRSIKENKIDLNHENTDMATEFLEFEKDKTYGPLYQNCLITLLNDKFLVDSAALADFLHAKMVPLMPLLEQLVRPTWDAYFLKLCRLAATRSNCMKRKIGCVLVTATTHRIIATGYNGTPIGLKNCNDGGCLRCNTNCGTGMDLAACLCIHAEENALLEAGRERISKYRDTGDPTLLYCTTCPCLGCTKKIIQCGIKEVIYADPYHMDTQCLDLFRQVGVPCRQISSDYLLKSKIYL